MTSTSAEVVETSGRAWRSYPAYKDSGVEWLGGVPAHWETKRLRFISRINPPKSEVTNLPADTIVSFLPMELIGDDGSLALDETRTIEQVQHGYTYFRIEDVLVAKITPCFENGKGALCRDLVNGIGFGTTELHVLRAGGALLPKFLLYLLRSHPFRDAGAGAMYGAGGQKRVPEDFVRNFLLALPPLPEQSAIIDFLDCELALLDQLVAKKERLIALLEEKRAALISWAVTKGVDPSAPMKDSGAEWLGEVPAHWEAKRIKWVARMESGHTPDRKVEAYWTDCDIPWVSLNDSGYLRDHDYISETAYSINALGLANSSARFLPPRAVVFSRDATIGLCAITTRPMATSQHFIAWICGDEIIPEYLLQVFHSMTAELERLTMGATLKTIGMPDVKTLITPVPPRREQEAIVAHIRTEAAKLDAIIAKTREQLARLQEYRTALISAAVTGKIDVREEARR